MTVGERLHHRRRHRRVRPDLRTARTAGAARKASTSPSSPTLAQTRALAESQPLAVPVLTVDAASAPFTEQTFRQVAAGPVSSVRLEGVGHLVAQEAPEALSAAMLEFTDRVDQARATTGTDAVRP